MKQSFLIFGVFIVFFISCQKEKLPKLTEEGKNTFGCKVNGKNWVPHGRGGFSGIGPTSGGFFQNTHTIYITAYNDNESIEFYLENVFNAGEYSLNLTTLPFPDNLHPKNYGLYLIESNNNTTSNRSFITTAQYTGKINIINLDTTYKIVSGTFEFRGVDNTGKTVAISDGRFDIKSH